MGSSLGVILFIATLTAMVIIHEFGHYITARRFGMKVEAFFFGFGPRIFSWRRGETEYGMRAIPLGGYVKIAGMNPLIAVPERDKERVFGAKPAWQRAIVLSAGSATHYVLAFVILLLLFAAIGDPQSTTTVAEVSRTIPAEQGEITSPASLAGFQAGDEIVAINEEPVSEWAQVLRLIGSNAGNEIVLTIERGGETLTLTAVPVATKAERDGEEVTVGLIGLYPKTINVPQPLPRALWSSVKSIGYLTAASVQGIFNLFSFDGIRDIIAAIGDTGERRADGTSPEPIGIVGAGGIAGQFGSAGEYQQLLFFLAAIVVFVGVINLVPLPILDGGYLGILLVEKIIRRPVDMRKVIPAMVVVFGFFILLGVTLLYLDLVRPIRL